jgi:hypothetical protein
MAVLDCPERLICWSGILCSSREELTGASLSRPRSSRGCLALQAQRTAQTAVTGSSRVCRF